MSIHGTSKVAHKYGEMKMISMNPVTLVTAGVWYPLRGVFSDGGEGFELDPAGILTVTHLSGKYLVTGVSNLEVSGACRVTYGMFLNGELASPQSITPHDFVASAKIGNISITCIPDLEVSNELDVRAMADTDGIVLTPASLAVTVWGRPR